jgi:hypothetical protein
MGRLVDGRDHASSTNPTFEFDALPMAVTPQAPKTQKTSKQFNSGIRAPKSGINPFRLHRTMMCRCRVPR